jgi:hypothetical protein
MKDKALRATAKKGLLGAALFASLALGIVHFAKAQTAHGSMQKAPPRAEGEGPYPHLFLRNAILIDGTGAPPVGPVDIIIEKNRISRIDALSDPGAPLDARAKAIRGDREIDLAGMYVLPGFINMHTHIGPVASIPAEYIYKLWLGHGITTIREVWCENGVDWVLEERGRSERNEITAPRIRAYCYLGLGHTEPLTRPSEARKWVDALADRGVDGIKFFGLPPDQFQAALDEAKKRNLRSAAHLSQQYVARANALDTARWGLTTLEHWYGLPESLFDDRTVQDFPPDYNYANEAQRFGYAGRLWLQAAAPGSAKWIEVRDELLKLGLTLDPTFSIYDASRDFMRVRRAEWHTDFTLPALWQSFAPSQKQHGAYFYRWTTEDEVAWKQNYRRWMDFIADYSNHGGRVITGEDAGYIYSLYGFGYIRELELLREAGLHPLEVFRAATLNGAEALGIADKVGTVEPGKLADLVVVSENPLANIASLYGTGTIKLSESGEIVRAGGVRYTIKDGIVYDAAKLRADVRRMVDEAKEKDKSQNVQAGISNSVSVDPTSNVALSGNQDSIADRDSREQLIGAWRLAWVEELSSDRKLHKVDRGGILLYTRDGRMSVQIMARAPEAARPAGPVTYELGGYEAYYGRYDVNQRAHTVTHHVEGALVRALIGSDLTRVYQFSGKQLILKSSRPDEHWTVAWERYH